jgi:hypothetical protein
MSWEREESQSEPEGSRRRPPFGLYDTFLEAERDDVYEHLSVRLKWFGEDCLRASARIHEHARYGLELIEHLSTTVQQLDKIAGAAQAKEEAMRQAVSWRIAADDLLPNDEEVWRSFTKREEDATGSPDRDPAV